MKKEVLKTFVAWYDFINKQHETKAMDDETWKAMQIIMLADIIEELREED